ncbi:hypothetical protein RUND412_004965 [Rhizina undulata]
MRGKRSKAYRKLMGQYQLTFGFREPYQTLVDAEIIKDASKFKMDLPGGLERTFHGKVKLMITQCSIRHLYSLSATEYPYKESLIDLAKTFERRRCNHHELSEPLPEKECLESVIVHNGENKHRYCVATQSPEIRSLLRGIPGVPLVYINRSVMILEPMAPISQIKREREERGKFRLGIIDNRPAVGQKRKREAAEGEESEKKAGEDEEKKKKKKKKGPKGPNPLSVKKRKPKTEEGEQKNGQSSGEKAKKKEKVDKKETAGKKEAAGEKENAENAEQAKKKRKRKHVKGAAGGGSGGVTTAAEVTAVAAGEAAAKEE